MVDSWVQCRSIVISDDAASLPLHQSAAGHHAQLAIAAGQESVDMSTFTRVQDAPLQRLVVELIFTNTLLNLPTISYPIQPIPIFRLHLLAVYRIAF